MSEYRFHRLDRDGRRQGAPVDSQCKDDCAAVEYARDLIQRRREMIEVWSEGRFLTIATRVENSLVQELGR